MHIIPAVENAPENEDVSAVEFCRARAFTVGLLHDNEALILVLRDVPGGCIRARGNDV
jgi:hypothetical protein